MKTVAVILGVIGAFVATAGLYNMATSQTKQDVPEHVREMFINWKSENPKGYGATAEESFRLQIFYENYKKVNDLNAKGGATFALNLFADLSSEEFKIQYMGYKHEEGPRKNVKSLEGLQIPDQVDWTAHGAVNTPQNQKQCGGCYAFASTGALEGLTYIKTGKLYNFSKQQIIDCSKIYGNNGCKGGTFEFTFEYTSVHGMVQEVEYPFMNEDTYACNSSQLYTAKRYNTTYESVPKHSNVQLMAALSRQPVGVAVFYSQDFQFYVSGVFDVECSPKVNHAVLAVGYGTDAVTGKDFYKIKNSYGDRWGEEGYIRLARRNTDGPGTCGVLVNPVYPVM